jgi:hypothetical protein
MDRVALVFGLGTPPSGGGKMLVPYFVPEFAKALARNRVSFRSFANERSFVQSGWGGAGTIVILIYGEDILAQTPWVREAVRNCQASILAKGLAGLIVHSSEQGELLSSKLSTNRFYARCGIPVPDLITSRDAGADVRIFSNTVLGTKCQTQILSSRDRLDDDRYNTRFIDTTFGYRGKRYYVSLRAMCVGREMMGLFVRARDTDDGDASVHTADTPVDSELLNAIYRDVAAPRLNSIREICAKIGEVLGPGFYAHDLLPEASSNRVLVSESGFKFDDKAYRARVEPLRGQLLFERGLFGDERARAAQALLDEAKNAATVGRAL